MSTWIETRNRWVARFNRWRDSFLRCYSQAAWAEDEQLNWMIPYVTCPWEFPLGPSAEATFEDRLKRSTAADEREEACQRARAEWESAPAEAPKPAVERGEEPREAWTDERRAA